MQMQGSSLGQADTGSVALPAVLRAGKIGPAWFSVGSVQPAKFSSTSHQAHTGHMASTVSDMLHSNVFFCKRVNHCDVSQKLFSAACELLHSETSRSQLCYLAALMFVLFYIRKVVVELVK